MVFSNKIYALCGLVLSIVLLVSACINSNTDEKIEVPEDFASQNEEILPDTLIKFGDDNFVRSVIFSGAKGVNKGNILVLPGWNYSMSSWCDSSDLCELASEYNLIFPDMQKSIYHLKNYDQTRADWRKYPSRLWVEDTLIPYLQDEFNILKHEQSNYIIGLSTGARGAYVLANEMDSLIDAVACLSGDFNQLNYPNDNLYKAYWGSLALNRRIWEQEMIISPSSFNVPVYIGHGRADRIVPVEHAIELADTLKTGFVLHINDTAGHNYAYWNSEIPEIIKFFEKQ